MNSVLPIDRFKTLLSAYGARLELWPETERAAAQALIESSLEARELVRAEAGLDALFAESLAPDLPPDLARRLAELPISHSEASRIWSVRRMLWPALGWALAAAFGLVLGSSVPDTELGTALDAATVSADPVDTAEPSADEARDEDETELLEMALGPVFGLEELP
jgi:hypothetical protein